MKNIVIWVVLNVNVWIIHLLFFVLIWSNMTCERWSALTVLLVLTQSVICYELGNCCPSCFSLLWLFECYVFERQRSPQRGFFRLVLCLVFTPLIGYQVSLVDSPIRRLSMVAGILDDHLTTEERLGSSSFVVFDLLLSSWTTLFSRNEGF